MARAGKPPRRVRARRGIDGTLPGEARSAQYQQLDFERKNWILIGAGLVAVVLGFVLLSVGSLTAAPILLVLGYLVLIPWGIVTRSKPGGSEQKF